MSAYRIADPPPPFAAVEPDPFPEEECMKQVEDRKVRAVALAARKFVRAARAADFARQTFADSPKLLRETELAVSRAFSRLIEVVDAWERRRK